ncbi:hypothetical protein HDU93_010027 [Gonapodya sp. JEL0774]|nr:hypothetical protein HDU93_010027 [Gonapodya sp. JEL0774]
MLDSLTGQWHVGGVGIVAVEVKEGNCKYKEEEHMDWDEGQILHLCPVTHQLLQNPLQNLWLQSLAEASQFCWSNPVKRMDLLMECLDKKPYMKGREFDPITKTEKVVTIAEKWEQIANYVSGNWPSNVFAGARHA